jgi:hypothetical protein
MTPDHPIRTEDLVFYHGTRSAGARSILMSGSRDSLFEDIGAFALGREIRRALLANAKLSSDQDTFLLTAFTGPGSENSVLWVSALRQLEDPTEKSHFVYGHFL